MSRYIDADKFYASQVARCWGEPIIGTCASDNSLLYDELQKLPTADVKEVKHGQWNTVLDESILEHCNNDVDIFACSICGIKSKRPTIFCPSCGARMDGKEAERE